MFRKGLTAVIKSSNRNWIIKKNVFANVRYSSTGSQPPSGVPYKQYQADSASAEQELPQTADAVVIGGGISGCSTLYHLARLGMTDVVLLEKDQLTAGTSWHTAGLLWHLRPSDVDMHMGIRAHHFMTTLEEETGVNTGWQTQGGLLVAQTKERLDEYKRLHTFAKVFSIESHILDPGETKDLYPLMHVSDLYGAVYCPVDGTIDPAGFCTALARGAVTRGAKVVQNCAVDGIYVHKDTKGRSTVQMVHTSKGSIKTPRVVNCAGVWSRDLGQMAGVNVPLYCMKHAYVVTDAIEGVRNMPNSRDQDAAVYLRVLGDTIQIGGYESNPVVCDPVSKDFAFSLYDLDWDVFSAHIEGAMHRIPILQETGIKSTVCGPESFTPDLKPLIGESPEVKGFYVGCGYNAGGFHYSGCSEQLAKWIIDGRPEIDMFGYDIRRFNPKLTNNMQWVSEKSHESYSKHYSIHFPKDEPLAGRNQIKDPLHGVLLDAGCVYQERHGWERPGWFATDDSNNTPLDNDYYGNYDHKPHADYKYKEKLEFEYTFDFPKQHDVIGKECMACRESVAVFNMSYFGNYYLIGPEAQNAADWLFTNDMRKSPGSTVYTCMLNEHAGIELDLTVSALEPGDGSAISPKFKGHGFYLAIGGSASHHAYCYIRDVIQDKQFDCSIINHSSEMCLLSVQGPKSRQLLQSLTTSDLSDEAFHFSTNQIINIAGHECRALRLSFVGELGWELHVPNISAVEVYQAIIE